MKNSTNTNTWLLVVIIILLFLCLFKLYSNNNEIHIIEALPANKEAENKKSVPTSVQAKYEVLRQKYASSLGATLEFCTKGNEKMYTVSGSGGFSGDNYYYDMKGNQIGFETYDDIGGGKDLRNSIEKDSYQCSVLETSMKYKSQ